MLKILADEDFDNRIVKGLRLRNAEIDLVRVQDVGLTGRADAEVLEWAAQEGRVVATLDVNTMIAAADARVRQGLAMPGLLLLTRPYSLGAAVRELELWAECALPEDCDGLGFYLDVRPTRDDE